MKKSIICICILFMAIQLSAQDSGPVVAPQPEKPRTPLRDRLFFGGNIGLNFGTLTYIAVSPIIGYRLTDKLGTGLGPTYTYFKDHRDRNYKYETHTYGGRTFLQYQVLESGLLYFEYEMVNIEVPDLRFTKLFRKNVSSLFLGGGYTQQFGRSSALTLMVLFNVIESDYQIYENPIIRTGINVGF